MSILDVNNITHKFGDKLILDNISFRLLKGDRVGLVGINGAGKTTFMDIISNKISPDIGTVKWHPSVNVGYFDQHSQLDPSMTIKDVLKDAFKELFEIEHSIFEISEALSKPDTECTNRLLNKLGHLQDILYSSDFYSIDTLIESVANGLGIGVLGLDTSISTLSGGQRAKVLLAKLLLSKPDVLLLDEPTNYLDDIHIEWLSKYLKDYPGSFIVISHNVQFVNSIVNIIYHIEFANIKRYPGNYSKFLELKAQSEKEYEIKYLDQQKKIQSDTKWIQSNIARASTTKRAQSRQKQLDKMKKLEKPTSTSKPDFNFHIVRKSVQIVFKCKGLKIGYSFPILSGLALTLERGEKIAVTGCNGIGKSTLLKTVLGVIPPLSGSLEHGDYVYPAYFEQELKTKSNFSALDDIWHAFPNMSQKDIRGALAKCGLKQEHVLQKMSCLSGGEQAKVRLCKLMLKPSNWLVLDEITNHLDTDAKLVLKEALKTYEGTVLLVCHEKDFFNEFVTNTWNLESLLQFKKTE